MASQNWKGGIFLFPDKRSRRLVLAAHCLLNQNASSDGTADYPGAHEGEGEGHTIAYTWSGGKG